MTPADLKDARNALGLSQAALALLLGVTVHAVRHWEHGIRPVNPTAAAFLRHLEADRQREQA